MALRANGTSGNYARYDSTPPNWGALTVCGFFKISTDRNAWSTVINCGYPTTTYDNEMFAVSTTEDGTTLTYWENSMGGTASLGTATVGRTYGLAIRNSGTALAIHLLDTVTGSVTTVTPTLPSGYVGTSMNGLRLGDSAYNEPLSGTLFGWKLFSADIGESRALSELRTILPFNSTNLHAWWPMVGNTKALCLIDYSGNGRHLTEQGTANFTVEDGGPISWGGQPIISPVGASLPAILAQYGFRFYNDDGVEAV